MLTNSVVQITTSKLIGAALLPSSMLLIGGLIAWRVWYNKQTRLQAKTDELNDELRQIKEQMSEFQSTTLSDKNPSTFSAKHPAHQKSEDNPERMGLFEYLIEDNIQIRQ